VNPDDLRYTAEHEWVRVSDDGSTARIGITDYAQDALGDIVYVHLPDIGDAVTAGGPMGELESTKSVSDLFAPVTGTVQGRNEDLDPHPELVNSDPYGAGWVVEIAISDASQLDGLMSAGAYEATVTSQ
jgi:glycine cleavage system H protein